MPEAESLVHILACWGLHFSIPLPWQTVGTTSFPECRFCEMSLTVPWMIIFSDNLNQVGRAREKTK